MSESTPSKEIEIGDHVFYTENGSKGHHAIVLQVDPAECAKEDPPKLALIFVVPDKTIDKHIREVYSVPHVSKATEPPFWQEQ